MKIPVKFLYSGRDDRAIMAEKEEVREKKGAELYGTGKIRVYQLCVKGNGDCVQSM